ncbi:DUF551 domain-containing protein [Escherichia coli]|nr:DUF551 domain-containing protein [Escherichia coli]
MITITKGRLLTIKQWRETYGPGSNVVLPAEEAEELARIALASLEADPVKRVNSDQMHRVCLEANRYLDKYDAMAKEVNKLLGRIAPPATVLPHEWRLSNAQAFIERYSPPSVEEAALFAWNSCRAAMLHGAEPVSQTYKLPVNTPCQDAPAHIWLQTAGVWPEDGELSELTWCSHNQHHDDTLYVRADLVNGNYPVTPDGWISCSERMPEMGERQCYVLAADFKNNYPPNIPNTQVGVYGDWFNDGNPTWDDGGGEDLYLKEVTHWMPLPEPPQEVNRG